MKKAFSIVIRSKETEMADGKLVASIKDAVTKAVGGDVKVVVKRTKELDPVK